MERKTECKDFKEFLTKNYRVLPLYERPLFDYVVKKHVSLQRSEYFACKWQEFKDNIGKKRAAFRFPKNTDFHFYNYQNCFKPSESITERSDYRFKLVPGPGVDDYGDIPIPHDPGLRSTVSEPKRKSAIFKTIKKHRHKRC